MALSKAKKEVLFQEVKEKLDKASVLVLTNYKGLNVSSATKLRRELRNNGSELKVSKNTITLKAVKELGYEGLEEYLQGPTAIAFGFEDLVSPAKIISEFAKTNKALEIKGGYLEGRAITADEVKYLADLPSKEVLLGQLVGGMQSPMYGFAGCLQGMLRNFVYGLEAIRKQKEETA